MEGIFDFEKYKSRHCHTKRISEMPYKIRNSQQLALSKDVVYNVVSETMVYGVLKALTNI
jgi:hypothetical protein